MAQQRISGSVLGFYKDTPECSPPPSDYDHLKDSQACLHEDLTILTNYNGKLNYQLNASNKFAFLYNFSDKRRNARGASATRPPETTYRQYNSRNPLHAGYNIKHTWVLTDKLVFDSTVEILKGGFSLDFQDPTTQFNLQPLYDDDTNTWHRSIDQYITERPTVEAKTDSSYFLSNLLGGDHALKFGFRYHASPWSTFDHYGGYAIALINSTGSSTGGYAYLERDANYKINLWQYGAYLQDSYSRGRLRLNLGLRWDYQDDKALTSSTVANPIVPDYLPAYTYAGGDAGIVWNDVSPRLSATYDLLGDGKTILKGTYAYYYNQAGLFSDNIDPNTGVELRAEWNDLNGDQFITRDELDLSTIRVNSGNWDLTSGAPRASPNTIDPGLRNQRTREGIVGLEHELMANFGVGVNYIVRRFDRSSFTRIIGETADMWEEVSWTPSAADLAVLPAGTPTTGWTYWQIKAGQPVLSNVNNRSNAPSDVYGTYKGWEFTARKRLSNRWQMNGSFTWNDSRNYGTTSFNLTQYRPDARREQRRESVRGQAERQLPVAGRLERGRQREHPGRQLAHDYLPCRAGAEPASADEPHVVVYQHDDRLAARAERHDPPPDVGHRRRDGRQELQPGQRPPAEPVDHGVQPVQRGDDPGLLQQPAGSVDVRPRVEHRRPAYPPRHGEGELLGFVAAPCCAAPISTCRRRRDPLDPGGAEFVLGLRSRRGHTPADNPRHADRTRPADEQAR